MTNSGLAIERAQGCGGYVSGVDLSDLDADGAKAVTQAIHDHGVLFFRDQHLTPDGHVRLAEQMGSIEVNRFFPSLANYPMIATVEELPEQNTNIGGGWHTDHSYDRAPAFGSILVARALPRSGGGTLFADMYAAYDALDEKTKDELAGLCAVHSSAHIFGESGPYRQTRAADRSDIARSGEASPDVVHPVVIRHPGSGRPALYVNPAFTTRFEGWTRPDSLRLLKRLYRHATDAARVHRFVWMPGSVAIWDNRATWHHALNDYHGGHRLMHRITLTGERLETA